MPLQGPFSEWERDVLHAYGAVLTLRRAGAYVDLLQGLAAVLLD